MKKSDKSNKKSTWKQHIGMVFFMLIGAVCGLIMASYLNKTSIDEKPLYIEILSLFGMFLCLYAAMLFHIIIHEAGHLIFGLLTGYKFNSFRIFSFMLVKEDGKIKLKRQSIAGTAGQCLLAPPDINDGKIPFMLYNLGGVIVNIVTGLIFLGLYYAFKSMLLLSDIMLILAAAGFTTAAMNGLPMRLATVDNDGCNTLSLKKNPDAVSAFWTQMKISDQAAAGVRLKDMPDEWFTVPSDKAMENGIIAAIGVFACNRLVDEGSFDEADKLIAHILEINSGMIGLHRNLLICDRIYIELITENRSDVIDGMFTKEQKKFMKSMKTFISVLRTEYVYALLYEKNPEKADKIMAQFEKCAKTHPYKSDVQSEQELIEIARKKDFTETV